MDIDLSKNELELLESVLFTAVITARSKAYGKIDSSQNKYIDELENLGHKIWKTREGISL